MNALKQTLTVLGSTGSIGVNTLDVVFRHPEQFQVFALTGAKQVDLMLSQCAQFRPEFAVMVNEDAAHFLRERLLAENLPTQVLSGAKALDQVASDERVTTVMAAIVGAAGLSSCISAAKAGKRLLLANKEALVVGGQLFLDAVKTGGAQLLPIDSEHSAVFQSLPHDPSTWEQSVDKIILTASGGPFRLRDPNTLRDVTPEEACAHPNWVMGRKISVDSATMMNKALEIIEAKYLFGMSPKRIEVVIHPQSIIHSMVQFVDGSVVAQLGTPDMRVPIAYGLSWPQRMASGADNLNFRNLPVMTFESFDDHRHHERFPGLKLAWQALEATSGSTTVLNAANEVAVAAFLDKRIRFDQIHHLNLATMESLIPPAPGDLEDLLELDQRSRSVAQQIALKLN
jgi:1-deoxy-D-xylulose-5-phosphate reductoisomerase